MSEHSKIEWTDATWPLVAGCEFVSPECTRCYAVYDSWRMAHNPNAKIRDAFFGTVDKTGKGDLVWSGVVRTLPQRLAWPLKWRAPRRIFVCNLADLFHPKVPFEFIAAAWGVMFAAGKHTYQVLTKHPDRMLGFLEWVEEQAYAAWNTEAAGRSFEECRADFLLEHARRAMIPWLRRPTELPAWPLPNVHLGVTAGDQVRADERIPILMRCAATRRFLSYEPALGRVELRRLLQGTLDALAGSSRLDWVIAGGESGRKARAPDPDWFRRVRDDCEAAGVPFHFKQWGAWVECETDVLPQPPGKVIYPVDDDVQKLLSEDRPYDVIQLHGKEFAKVGKKTAGRKLDGRTHDGRIA